MISQRVTEISFEGSTVQPGKETQRKTELSQSYIGSTAQTPLEGPPPGGSSPTSTTALGIRGNRGLKDETLEDLEGLG